MKTCLNAAFTFLLLPPLFSGLTLARNKRQEAEDLWKRAQEISDIRANGSPPFRLRVSFKELGGTPQEGTYTETWVSHGEWRVEIEQGNFHRTEVGGRIKRWTLDSGQDGPEQKLVTWLGTVLQMPDLEALRKIKPVGDHEVEGVAARCVEGKDKSGDKLTFCFDKTTGALLLRQFPAVWSGHDLNGWCDLSDYQKFGNRMFPMKIRCREGSRPKLEAKVTELKALTSAPDARLFAPLVGAEENANCPSRVKPPIAVTTPDPDRPPTADPRGPVILWLTVREDGRPHNIRVVQSQGDLYDSAALRAVRQWRFKPAECGGEPVPVQINVLLTPMTFR